MDNKKKEIYIKNTKKILKTTGIVIRRTVIGLGFTAVTLITATGACGFGIYNSMKHDISAYIESGHDKVKNIKEDTFNYRYSTQVLDSNGTIIKEFKTADYEYSEYEEVNPEVFEAFVAIEDHRFYEHKGIDFKGLARAMVTTVTSKGGSVQGGSTITQQLVKNVFLSFDVSIWRKLEEMVIAQELEKIYSKEEILEFYVNNIYFGHGAYGIETASDYYYQKDTKDLTTAEVALLAGITNNPTLYDPITNKDNALKRRNIILQRMKDVGYITETEYSKFVNEPLRLNVKKVTTDNTVKGYDLEVAVEKSIEEIMKYSGFQFKYDFKNNDEKTTYKEKYSEAYKIAREEFISGGYTVTTSINPTAQEQLQSILDSEMAKYGVINKDNGLYMKQSAATLIDNKTGEIIAISGGRTQDGNTFNRALYGARQPGSAIKPVISYAPAYERGYSPDDKMTDKKITNGPANWYSGYKGKMTLRYATEISNNTIPYQLTSNLGANNSLTYLTNMNFRYIDPIRDNTPAISLGGFTNGVTTTELTSAFSTLIRNGNFITPTNVREISKRSNSKVIYTNNYTQKQIYTDGAAYLTVDSLKGVVNEGHGTGYKSRIGGFENQIGKTGTTDASKDVWFAGGTHHYSMSVWIGDDTPQRQYNMSGSVPGRIYDRMMTYMHKGLEDIPFKKPDSVFTSGGKLRTKGTVQDVRMQERYDKEEARKLEESNYQHERRGDEEYRIVYGLSEEEEKQREIKAESAINALGNYSLTSLSQETEVRNKIEETKTILEDVKRQSEYNRLKIKLDTQIEKLTNKLNYLYEQKRLEEEAVLEEQQQEEEDNLEVPEVEEPEVEVPEVEEPEVEVPEDETPNAEQQVESQSNTEPQSNSLNPQNNNM